MSRETRGRPRRIWQIDAAGDTGGPVGRVVSFRTANGTGVAKWSDGFETSPLRVGACASVGDRGRRGSRCRGALGVRILVNVKSRPIWQVRRSLGRATELPADLGGPATGHGLRYAAAHPDGRQHRSARRRIYLRANVRPGRSSGKASQTAGPSRAVSYPHQSVAGGQQRGVLLHGRRVSDRGRPCRCLSRADLPTRAQVAGERDTQQLAPPQLAVHVAGAARQARVWIRALAEMRYRRARDRARWHVLDGEGPRGRRA